MGKRVPYRQHQRYGKNDVGQIEPHGESAPEFHGEGGLANGTKVCKGEPLYPRIEIAEDGATIIGGKRYERPVVEAPKAEKPKPAMDPIKPEIQFPDFEKIDLRVGKVLAAEKVKKSKKLLKFTLNDGERTDRVILSGIHEYYEPEELVGKTAIAIVNLPPRKMMGIDSEGMLISAVHEEDGHEGLNLLMVDDRIPAGAKLY